VLTGGLFDGPTHYAVGSVPNQSAVVDFNADGKLDVAVSNANTLGGYNVSVLLGNGDGTLQAAIGYAAGSGAHGIATGDFNADGKPDLVTANFVNSPGGVGAFGTVDVLLGLGDGTFAAPIRVNNIFEPSSVTVGDFNHDNHLDAVVTNQGASISGHSIQLLLGDGLGGLMPQGQIPAGDVQVAPRFIASSDLNGDGWVDLMVTATVNGPQPSGKVRILINDHLGSFTATDYSVGLNPEAVSAGDVDEDGHPDLVVANATSNSLSILLGLGDGTFQPPTSVSAPSPGRISLADVDQDGHLDVIAPNMGSSGTAGVSLHLGHGDGSFQSYLTFDAGAGPFAVTVADLNGDTKPDLIVANSLGSSVSVLLKPNQPPLLTPIGNQQVTEGTPLTFIATASDPDAESMLTYSLGPGAPLGAAIDPDTGIFTWTPADNTTSPTAITIRVTDQGLPALFDEETILVTVTNQAPTVHIAGIATAYRGEAVSFLLTATDPSSVDSTTDFTYRIDWDGNGSVDQTVVGPASGITVIHQFFAIGNPEVKATATDKDGGMSPVATAPISTTKFVLRSDGMGHDDLIWGGSNGFDAVFILPLTATTVYLFTVVDNSTLSNTIEVVSGVTGNIIAYGFGADDTLVGELLNRRIELHGGDGNDVLVGGEKNDLLDGGNGDDLLIGATRSLDLSDTLLGGDGRDVLFGHLGVDLLDGGAESDLLIADRVQFDDLPSAAFAIQAEWLSSRPYNQRVANLSGAGVGPRFNGDIFLLPGVTVFDDEAVDTLWGGSDLDWYVFRFLQDLLGDEESGEIKTGT